MRRIAFEVKSRNFGRDIMIESLANSAAVVLFRHFHGDNERSRRGGEGRWARNGCDGFGIWRNRRMLARMRNIRLSRGGAGVRRAPHYLFYGLAELHLAMDPA